MNKIASAAKSPLHSAVLVSDVAGVNALLDGGADVNEKDYNGVTPLHIASKQGNRYLIIALLRRGARPDIRNDAGKLPVDVAKDEHVKELLLGRLTL